MKICNYIIIVLLIFLTVCCRQKKTEEPLNWSNSRLLEIPSKIRLMQYRRGNLINNPSFEDRKLLRLDSINYTFNIAFWKKEGSQVKYIDRLFDSLVSPNEMSDGNSSIKISKKTANEFLEKGEGITSDFIKVIPGMYDLFFDIKCKDIEPYNQRYNNFLNDAVDVKLLFYDRNKLQIIPEIIHPLINKKIDNSFKGISFSHFNKIDSTGWCTVKGVSGYYPFNESIIPDDAKFVKVYIGLKGTGTIWIDNIRLFYSKENLTPRERSNIYFDSLNAPTDLIIPKPHKVEFIDSLVYFNPDSGLYLEPFILLPDNSKINEDVVENIKNKLIESFAGSKYKYDIREIKTGQYIPDAYKTGSLIISIGNTSMFRKYKSSLPVDRIKNKVDGYIIDFKLDSAFILFIYGETARSIYYGSETAIQLIRGFKVMASKIIDYPCFKTRSVISDNKIINPSIIKIIEAYKLNVIFNPEATIKNNYIESNPLFYSSNFKVPSFSEKKSKVLLKADDNLKTLDVNKIIALSKKHQKEINTITGYRNHVYFIPPFSSNQDIINQEYYSRIYFDLFKTNSNISFVSCGSHSNSQYFDDIQKYFYQTFTGHYPVYTDNFQDAKTPSVKMNTYYKTYPEKIPMGNIFDPYDNMKLIANGDEIMLQIKAINIFEIFRIATFGEYAWNPYEFDPDLSLFKVIVKEYGRETAQYFYYFNDAYCGLLSTINKIFTEGTSGKTSKSVENEIVMLNASYEKIKKLIPDHTDIIDYLFILKISVIEKYNQIYEKAIIDKKMKEDSTYSSIFKPLN